MVPMTEIGEVWADNDVDGKLAAGVLRLIVVHESVALNPMYSGGRSQIVKVFTPNERHIGTFHAIVMPDGSVAHRHPKDYTLRDCSRIRVESE